MPVPARLKPPSRHAAWVSACVVGVSVLALTVGGCGGSPSGPKAGDSAKKMSADAKWLGAKYRTFFTPTTPFTVTQDGTKAKSCGHGKASYSFAGNQTFRVGSVQTDLVAMTVGSWLTDRGYQFDPDVKTHDVFNARKSEPLLNKKAHIHLTVTATAASDHATTELWTVTSHTDCLRTG